MGYVCVFVIRMMFVWPGARSQYHILLLSLESTESLSNNIMVCFHGYRWQKEKGSAATPRVLKAALTEMNLMGIVHTHFQ